MECMYAKVIYLKLIDWITIHLSSFLLLPSSLQSTIGKFRFKKTVTFQQVENYLHLETTLLCNLPLYLHLNHRRFIWEIRIPQSSKGK